jgi:hypothetical protein
MEPSSIVAGESVATMTLTIELLDSTTVAVNMHPQSKVFELKHHLGGKTGIPVQRMRLFSQENPLLQEEQLLQNSLTCGETVVLVDSGKYEAHAIKQIFVDNEGLSETHWKEEYSIITKCEDEENWMHQMNGVIMNKSDNIVKIDISASRQLRCDDEGNEVRVPVLPQLLCTSLDFLTELKWADCGLTSIPSVIDSLQMLKSLDVQGSALAELPTSLQNLRSLTYLNISRQRQWNGGGEPPNREHDDYDHGWFSTLWSSTLTELPAAVCQLVSLLEFHCSGNEISSVPDEFSNLTSLTSLHFDDGEVGNCSFFDDGQEGKRSFSLPSTLGDLVSLKNLPVTGHNEESGRMYSRVGSFPASMVNLSASEDLTVCK